MVTVSVKLCKMEQKSRCIINKGPQTFSYTKSVVSNIITKPATALVLVF